MSNCARCGQKILLATDKVAINKFWHRYCFTCCCCNQLLTVQTAKLNNGELYCNSCYQDESKIMRLKSGGNCDKNDWTHSCSCIPVCCQNPAGNTCRQQHCQPKLTKPTNYPPRTPSPNRCKPVPVRTNCQQCKEIVPNKCCPSPRISDECEKPPPIMGKCCFVGGGGGGGGASGGACGSCGVQPPFERRNCRYEEDMCRRCGEKVFAAEKVKISTGSYHIGCFYCFCCCKSLCITNVFEADCEIYCRQCYNSCYGLSYYGYNY